MTRTTEIRLAVRCCRAAVCLVLLFLTTGQRDVGAQVAPTAAASETKAPAPPPTPVPIGASEIPSRAAAAAVFARGAVDNAARGARALDIQENLEPERTRIDELRKETTEQLKVPGRASTLMETEKTWGRIRDRLDRWQADLTPRSTALDGSIQELEQRVSLWKLTRDSPVGASLPAAVARQVTSTIDSLSAAEREVRSARDTLLDLQASIAQERMSVDEMVAQLQVAIAQHSKGVFGLDSEPLWKALFAGAGPGDDRERFEALWQDRWRTLKKYATDPESRLPLWALVLLALIVLAVSLRRRSEDWVRQDESLGPAMTLVGRSLSAALVVTATLNLLLEPKAPQVWADVVGVVAALAFLRLVHGLLPASLRQVPWLAVLLLLLWRFVSWTPEGLVIHRLALLALSLGGAAVCWWMTRRHEAEPPGDLSPKADRAVLFIARSALVLFGLGGLADVVGIVDFSSMLLVGTVSSVLTGVLLWVARAILRSLVRLSLLTDGARRWGFAPQHSETVRRESFEIIDLFAAIAWVVLALKAFLALDTVLDVIRRILDWKVTFGSVSFDPGEVLIFGFVIWLSFRVAALVQFVLNVDLMPRLELPQGVPDTISRLTRYLVIGIGAVVASVAAGFDISKVTIVLGALGVGVGFGLQNIVNNFVSGLILLFERPIRVGDTLDVGNTGGVVETIGMRASTVSTWDGASIIIPNATLISERVVNWTLTHGRRRMVIPIGVAYGSDGDQAAQLMVEVAKAHKQVDDKPEPSCLLVAFGDSSLDFELRAWTAGADFVSVASDLRLAALRKLAEAGIEIPFPQREVLLKGEAAKPSIAGDGPPAGASEVSQ